MTFGFPAYHTEHYVPGPAGGGDLRGLVMEALTALAWAVKAETPRDITASTSLSLSSWGERVEIVFANDGSLTVTSKCALPTQCIDWGKNKRNVAKFIREVRARSRA